MRLLLSPLSLLYGLITFLRNLCWILFKNKRFQANVPLTCIGNISAGGSGKTPLGLFLVEKKKDESRVGVLLRGYKSESKEERPLRVLLEHSAGEVGDEALLYKSRFGDKVEVVISPDRVSGIKLLESLGVNHIFMDDGLQHLRVRPSESICVIEVDDLKEINSPSILSLLPSGRLREWPSFTLSRADLVVFSKKSAFNKEDEIRIGECVSKYSLKNVKKVNLLSRELYDAFTSEKVNASEIKEVSFLSTIARPQYVRQAVMDLGLQIKKEFVLGDHARVTENDWSRIRAESNESIVLTEKDLVKVKSYIKNANEVLVLRQEVVYC